MSTTVTYKGNTLVTVENNTKTLKTAGKYMEDDVILTDNSNSGGVIGLQEGCPIEISNAAAGSKVIYLQTDIMPYQEGSGDPSPTNIRPISGWTGADITRTGVNLFGGARLFDRIKTVIPTATTVDANTHVIRFSRDAEMIGRFASMDIVPFKPDTQYTFIMRGYSSSSVGYANLAIFYTDGTYQNFSRFGEGAQNVTSTIVLVSNAEKSVLAFGRYGQGGSTTLYCDECAVLEGVHTAEDFVSYTGETISMDWSSIGTIYAGSIDTVSGKLISSIYCKTLDGTESWTLINGSGGDYFRYKIISTPEYYYQSRVGSPLHLCSHFRLTSSLTTDTSVGIARCFTQSASGDYLGIRPGINGVTTVAQFKAWLAEQYANGTPVQVTLVRVVPKEYDINPVQITLTGGLNYLWANVMKYGKCLYYTAAGQEYQNIIRPGGVTQDSQGYLVLDNTFLNQSRLDYETGMFTPVEDIANYSISFSKTYNTLPFFTMVVKASDSYDSTTYTAHNAIYANWYTLFGRVDYASSTTKNYGSTAVRYRATNDSSFTSSTPAILYPDDNLGNNSNTYPRYWVTESGMTAYSGTASAYFRSGETYQWIAIWPPQA